MTWSGNMKSREGRQHFKRQRYNSSSSSRGSPSPKLHDDRCSPVQSTVLPNQLLIGQRISPPPRLADSSLSRSPSPQENAYAGAKFSDPPAPELLPKPPSHWMNLEPSGTGGHSDMASQLKMLLKVAAQA